MIGCGFTKGIITVFFMLVLLLSGCSMHNAQDTGTGEDNSVSTTAEAVQDAEKAMPQMASKSPEGSKSPRAIGKSDNGEILIIPTEVEAIEQLGAPSSLGEETDYSFKSAYKVVFKDLEGNVTDIAGYNGQIIGKDKSPIKIGKLYFKEIEIFYFKPISNLVRPDALYLFGVGKDEKAFQLSFEYPGKMIETTASSPGSVPEVRDNRLVISSWEPEKGSYKQFFELDVQKKLLRLIPQLY